MLSTFLKKQEHSVDWYYPLTFNEQYLIQYLSFTDEEISDKTQNILKLYHPAQLIDEVEDLYGIYDTEDDFDYLLNCDFYNFFSESSVDVPKCFKKTLSPKRQINNLDILKFSNYFMSSGLRYKSLKPVLIAFTRINNSYLDHIHLSINNTNWKSLYLIFNSLSYNNGYKNIDFKSTFELTLRGLQFQTSRHIYTTHDIFIDFIKKLSNVLPIFSFYIYKVDKRIYKNTRGKSGKYTFIWKYVSPYKRLYLVLFWLVRELKVSPGKSYKDRIYSTIYNFFFSINKTWIFRIKKFSHNYVYKNCRLTLAETYITSTK